MTDRQLKPLKKTLAIGSMLLASVAYSVDVWGISTTTAQQKQLYSEILTSFLPTMNADFKVELTGGAQKELKIGSLVTYEFTSSEDCYVTLINIDSQGTVNLITPWDGNRLQAGETRVFPETEFFEVLEIQAPTGVDTMAAFCTTDSIPEISEITERDSIFEGQEAADVLSTFMLSLSTKEARFDRQLWQQRIVGRSHQSQYSESDVVSFFSAKTRSIKSRKLPLEINFKYNSAELTSNAKSTLNMIGLSLIHI